MALTKIEKPLLGPIIELGEQTIQPVAKLDGWYGGQAGWLQITPTVAVIHNNAAAETYISLEDKREPSLPQLLFSALIIAAVCQAIILLVRKYISGK